MGRILGLDVGDKRIGVAVSDPLGMFAIGLETIELGRRKAILAAIKQLCAEYGIERLIIGLPRHMDGREGHQAEKVRRFAEDLAKTIDLPQTFLDERLTSKIAEQTLREQGVKYSKHKGLIDQAAAQRILQDYLDRAQ